MKVWVKQSQPTGHWSAIERNYELLMTNVTNTEDSLNTLEENQTQTYRHGWRRPSNKLQVRSSVVENYTLRDFVFTGVVFAVRTFNPNLSGSICLSDVLSICQNTMVDCWQELKHCIVIPMIYWTLEVLLSLWPSQSRPGIRIAMTSKNWQCWCWNCLIARKRQVISNMLLTLYNAGLPGGSTGRYFLHKIQKP